MSIKIKNMTKEDLSSYVCHQLNSFFPDKFSIKESEVNTSLDEALKRLEVCINSVKVWRENQFDVLQSSQNCIFLYYLANTIFENKNNENLCTKLFYLNKALNGFECFYTNRLPEKFFIGHSVGIVLVKNDYPNYIAFYQGSTVGRITDKLPKIGEKVILYPYSSIIGDSQVGKGSVIAKGVNVVNKNVPDNVNVFSNADELVFKSKKQELIEDIFRL